MRTSFGIDIPPSDEEEDGDAHETIVSVTRKANRFLFFIEFLHKTPR
jgi:hypothetical protein